MQSRYVFLTAFISFSGVMRMRNLWTILFSFAAMFVLILDTPTALEGVKIGLDVCLKSVIPSLFPFIIVSNLLNSSLIGRKLPVLRPLLHLLRIPQGSDSIILIGFLGGYPVGAQAITKAYHTGHLSKKDAERMLAFSSNAGPAFIFGFGSQLLKQTWLCWLLWGIHIISAITTGMLTPGTSNKNVVVRNATPLTLTEALSKAIETMGLVCGWIILFRLLITMLERWFLWLLPNSLRCFLYGVLELANGSCSLISIESLGMRFVLFSAMLALGGLCVAMQTRSVCNDLSIRLYFLGKLTQAAIAVLLSSLVQPLLPTNERYAISPVILAICCLTILSYHYFSIKLTKKDSNSSPAMV